jgi:hypothetical protein
VFDERLVVEGHSLRGGRVFHHCQFVLQFPYQYLVLQVFLFQQLQPLARFKRLHFQLLVLLTQELVYVEFVAGLSLVFCLFVLVVFGVEPSREFTVGEVAEGVGTDEVGFFEVDFREVQFEAGVFPVEFPFEGEEVGFDFAPVGQGGDVGVAVEKDLQD